MSNLENGKEHEKDLLHSEKDAVRENRDVEEKNESQITFCDKPKEIGYGCRHQQAALLFVCLMVAYSMRTCMGVALVAMVHSRHDSNTDVTNSTIDIQDNNQTEIGSVGLLNGILFTEPYPTFRWNKTTQDYMLAAFSWGYMILQIPAGQIAHRYGTRYLLTGALVINGVVSFCTPWAAFYGSWVFVVILRMIQGLSQSCFIPGMHTAFGKWAPLEERGRLSAFAYGGQALGTVLGLPITGFIAASPLGWPGIFRFYGFLSLSVGAVLWFFGADSPAEHPRISVAERRYIEEALGQTGSKGKHLKVPWKKLFRCKALYAIVVAHIGQTWGQLTLYTEVPAFMDKVMRVNIKANGLLTALPFLVMWFTNFFFSWFTDMLIVKKWLSVTNTRKLAHSLGCIPAAIGLISLAYVKKDIVVVETILVLTCAFKIAAHLGWHVNHIDLAPNFAGTMMSMSNAVSNLVGSLAPVVAGFLLAEDVTSEFLWRKVFLVAAGFYIITDLVYVAIGSAELQEWNTPKEDTKANIANDEQKPML
ncbi:putative inorganic phosphate cotransporter [Cydia fagiglandana]|uniref:putative inorganic phosphate cotransporter n=1 Tax=Cydia fagiglandana TaxID=1458189 RepID=UPI002FEE18B1